MNDKDESVSAYGADDEANFIKNMQILREQQGISQGEFARRMQEEGWTSFHQTTVSRIEKGERPVRLGEARGIAKILGTITSQMILSEMQFLHLRELELALMKMEEIHRRFQSLVGDLDAQRSLVDFYLREVLQQTPTEDMDPPIVERREITIQQAQTLLNKSYNELVNEYMESTSGNSPFISDEDLNDGFDSEEG